MVGITTQCFKAENSPMFLGVEYKLWGKGGERLEIIEDETPKKIEKNISKEDKQEKIIKEDRQEKIIKNNKKEKIIIESQEKIIQEIKEIIQEELQDNKIRITIKNNILYVVFREIAYDPTDFINIICCRHYLIGKCTKEDCTYLHLCMLDGQVDMSDNKKSGCEKCFSKENKERCIMKFDCKKGLACDKHHDISEKTMFVMSDTRSFERSEMCRNANHKHDHNINSKSKLPCHFAHNKKELLCKVCKNNHEFNNNNDTRNCVNCPSHFKSFKDANLYFERLLELGFIELI